MDYRNILKEENENVRERFALTMERAAEIPAEEEAAALFRDYFSRTAMFVRKIGELWQELGEEKDGELSLEELKKRNYELYKDVCPENYGESY